jgi:hypothetical protein
MIYKLDWGLTFASLRLGFQIEVGMFDSRLISLAWLGSLLRLCAILTLALLKKINVTSEYFNDSDEFTHRCKSLNHDHQSKSVFYLPLYAGLGYIRQIIHLPPSIPRLKDLHIWHF